MIFAKKRFFYAEISVRMSSARDSPAIAGFASSEAASARLSDVDLMLRGRHVWRLLSGIRFPALRFFFFCRVCNRIFIPQHYIPLRSDLFGTEVFFAFWDTWRFSGIFFTIGGFRHVLKPLSLVFRRGAIIALFGHCQRLLVRGTYAPFIWRRNPFAAARSGFWRPVLTYSIN